MAEWLKAADCKFVEIFYVGSNPTFSKLIRLSIVKKNSINMLYINFLFFKNIL